MHTDPTPLARTTGAALDRLAAANQALVAARSAYMALPHGTRTLSPDATVYLAAEKAERDAAKAHGRACDALQVSA